MVFTEAAELTAALPFADDPGPPETTGTSAPGASAHAPDDDDVLWRIRDLPPEIAVLLFSVGCLGIVLPGIVGTPAIVAGGLVLWPSKFASVESWFEKKFPTVHHKSMKQLNRFLDDLERRFPTKRTS